MTPLSFSTIHPSQFELTPCQLTYKGVDLGASLGNVKVTIAEKLAPLKSDQLGDTIIDHKSSGFEATIETMLAETQLKANWLVVFPMHKLVTDNMGNQSFLFDSAVGTSQVSLAGLLVLHPLSRAAADKSGDVLVWLATAEAKADYTFGPQEQTKLKVVWQMYPDFTTTPPRFLLFGDPTIGVVAAAAGAATAATGNTGNGTVTGITVYSAFTKTETVTLVCAAPGATGNFSISGSQSGPMGLATIGTTFNAFGGQLSLTVNAGGTPFKSGDSFTIATTAANFV